MNLPQLNAGVEDLVRAKQFDIIGLAFEHLKQRHMKVSHESGCSCAYCFTLREYVALKIRAHKLRRRFTNDEFFDDSDRTQSVIGTLDAFASKISEARELKNAMKHLTA